MKLSAPIDSLRRRRERRRADAPKATPLPAATVARRRPVVPATTARRYIDARSHMPPKTMRDDTGTAWRGTSRVLDPAARRKANERSWRRLKAEARRAYVESTREPAA